MSFLNIEEDELRVIKRRLAVRGLKPCMDTDDAGITEWEAHGPHRDMPYVVYVGPAYEKYPEDSFYVTIYPRAVYDLGDADWHNVDPDSRIYTTT